MKMLIYMLGVLAMMVVVAILHTFPTMWLWNYLMPALFGLATIGFWQALCMNMLAGILFGSTRTITKEAKSSDEE